MLRYKTADYKNVAGWIVLPRDKSWFRDKKVKSAKLRPPGTYNIK